MRVSRWVPVMLGLDALTALVVGLMIGLHTVHPWVRPSTMHLEPHSCGSVLRPHGIGELIFNGPAAHFQVQSCDAARHDSVLLTIGLFALAAVLLVLVAVTARWARRASVGTPAVAYAGQRERA